MARLKLFRGTKYATALAVIFVAALAPKSFGDSGNMYLSPASTTVNEGSSLTFSLRINPGGPVDGVDATISYDTSKLQFVSIDSTSSAFGTQLNQSGGGGTVNIVRGSLSGYVNGDALIANVTMKALVGSGVASLGLSGNATYSGSYTNPALAGASVTLKTPSQSSPSPNPAMPPTSSPEPNNDNSQNDGSGQSSSDDQQNEESQETQDDKNESKNNKRPVVSITDSTIEFTNANFKAASPVPVKVFIVYGVDGQLNHKTEKTKLAKEHDISLDPRLVLPGTTYSYQVISEDADGNQIKGQVQTFKTKGYMLKIIVLDENFKPLKNKAVVLRSEPKNAVTDNNGVAEFTDVNPGTHSLEYDTGTGVYSSKVVVANAFFTGDDGKQYADVQSLSVVYDGLALTSSSKTRFIVGGLIVIIIIGLYFGYAANKPGNPGSGKGLASLFSKFKTNASRDNQSKASQSDQPASGLSPAEFKPAAGSPEPNTIINPQNNENAQGR